MKKYSLLILAVLLAVFVFTAQIQTHISSSQAYAATSLSGSDCSSGNNSSQDCACPPPKNNTVQANCLFVNYIVPAINFLSIGVGVVVVVMVIVGAIQYSASAGNPQAVAAARKRIIMALVALLVYALAYAFLNFIIPGGVIPTS